MSSSRLGRRGARRVALRLFVSCLSLLLVFVALPLATSHAQDDPLPAEQTNTSKNNLIEFVPGEIIVRFRTEAIADVKEQSIAPLRSRNEEIPIDVQPFSEDGNDIGIVEGLRFVRVAPEETLQAIEALNARSDVIYAEPNYIRRRDLIPNDTRFGDLWGLRNTGQVGFNDATGQNEPGRADADIDADQAWDITTGSRSVVVGVIDEGIDITHQDLQANIWTNPGDSTVDGVDNDGNGYIDDTNGWDFFHNDRTVYDNPSGTAGSNAPDSHGTHVSGTIGAVGNNGVGVAGVNHQVSIMSLKILGSDDEAPAPTTIRRTIQAYNYAIAMRNRGVNLRVLNNSYGGGGKASSELDAINALNAAGILFVAAAGNDANDSDNFPHYPASYDAPNVISVAATNRFDDLAVFSTFGARTVSIGAPGRSILSTTPGNTYNLLSGTSMATPHVAGAAALVCAAYPNISVSQLRGVIAYSGEYIPSLQSKTTTGRRLNVYNSLLSAGEGDTTAPAQPGNLRVSAQDGRSITLSFTAPGDDGNSGQAADYDVLFTDPSTNSRYILPTSTIPAAPGTAQSITVNLPYRRFSGNVTLRTIDNAGNASEASVSVTVTQNAGSDPYITSLTSASGLVGGGTGLALIGDDVYRENHALPFAFPFFGQSRTTVTVSSNGALYFSEIPQDGANGLDAGSSIEGLTGQTMIAGMWDDLRTDRNNGDVFVTSDSNRVIFRWQGTTFNTPLNSGPRGENPINFEIELRPDGTIQFRYGDGNTRLFPVVGISGGEPDAYVVSSHTVDIFAPGGFVLKNLTNAQTVTFSPRPATPPPPANPIDGAEFFVRQHYRDFFSREGDAAGVSFWTNQITACGTDAECIDRARVNTSAAFYISIEFQQTGFLVYRIYQSAFGRQPRFAEFLPDTQAIGAGVVVGQPGWEAVLEANKVGFTEGFVQRASFTSEFPTTLSAGEYVDRLFQRAGLAPTASERQAAIDGFGGGGVQGRARALRVVAENQRLFDREYNPAFVLMQYFGYLRRNPNDAPDTDFSGYNFWVGQLGPTGGPYSNMVRAFIVSQEYRRRFGAP